MGKLRLDSSACLLGAVCLLLLPLDWLLAAFFAASFHEVCHALAIRLTGGRIEGMRIGGSGAVIKTGPITGGQELICALAGPTGSLLLLLFVRWIPKIALCAAIQGAFNLLPIFPLDGGRILRSALGLLFRPEQAEKIAGALESGAVLLILLTGAVLTIRCSMGLMPVLLALFLTARAILRKIPCKPAKLGVQ